MRLAVEKKIPVEDASDKRVRPDVAADYALLVAIAIALFGALIHWVAPLLGPHWYAFLHAPDFVVESARQRTWLAPVGTVIIGALMFLCGLYALSAMGRIRRLPFTRSALVTISLICLIRGLILVPFLLLVPGTFTGFNVVGSLVWFIAGLGFAFGAFRYWPRLRPSLRA